jgi:hypothetical protein
MSLMYPNNNYSCSSWNYGAYAACNPCYIQQIKAANPMGQNRYNPAQNANLYNKYGKRTLREEERIVTNEYLKNINHMKKMEKSKDLFRTKSAHGLRVRTNTNRNTNTNINNNNNNNNINNNQNEQNINNTNTKTDMSNYKFRLTFDEWLEVKNKQRMIFNQIKKIKEQEDEKMEKINMKVDKKYKEIKDKKYKEWLDQKNMELRMKKQLKMQEELMKEEIKKEKDERREEIMNEWFKRQAKKMEQEILEQQEEMRRKKEKEKNDEEEKKRKKKESKQKFKEWKEKKDEELREKKREKILKENETKSKSKHSNLNRINNKGFTIGPYTDAGALKEIQKFVAEKCTEDDDEEEGIVNDENEEMVGMGDEMTPQQLEELKKLQLMQMNQYMANVDEEHQVKDNKDELMNNQFQQHDEDDDAHNISV